MKITGIFLYYVRPVSDKQPVLLAQATEVSSFGYFQQKPAKEFMLFATRTIATRLPLNQRQSITEGEYVIHCLNQDGLCCLVCADSEYPSQTAFAAVRKVLDEYVKDTGASWQEAEEDVKERWPFLESAIADYQDPVQTDKILLVKMKIQETKAQAVVTLAKLMERGESMETLAAKSKDLGLASKQFVKNSKDLNKCCKYF
eukprot:TRINITY_DN5319_c0_g1_i1.p1 TRINITY_DN5319_c0_g1~~TRINITY_DN5319_c0_g1_i1.p1  ORF type:complete len:201 (-),score=36.01 TRINITY_DN5319_c0_g1_i1:480-1082(-)